MKKILLGLTLTILLMMSAVSIIQCSGATFVESYEQQPVHSRSIGEGSSTYIYTYKGKDYIVFLGEDGKYYAVEAKEGGK